MQTDSNDLHVQPKSGDFYAIGIEGTECFPTRNPSGVIYVKLNML